MRHVSALAQSHNWLCRYLPELWGWLLTAQVQPLATISQALPGALRSPAGREHIETCSRHQGCTAPCWHHSHQPLPPQHTSSQGAEPPQRPPKVTAAGRADHGSHQQLPQQSSRLRAADRYAAVHASHRSADKQHMQQSPAGALQPDAA